MRTGVLEVMDSKEAAQHPLLRQLFRIEGVSSVFLGPDFVSVNKADSALWKHIKPEVYSVLMSFFSQSDSYPIEILIQEALNCDSPDSEVVQMIKELIETRIRPIIQNDGGDVLFLGFVNGYVRLKLQGACRTCSSSEVTLKNGIENMLLHYIPEVKGVEQVEDELVA